MRRIDKIKWLLCFIVAGTLSFHFSGFDALASEGPGGWRPIYDEVLLWLNFGILAFVLIKFGRAPLKNFLRGSKEKIAREIERVEDKKKLAVDKMAEINKKLEESEARFANLKDRIVKQGESKKQEILDSAQQQSKAMLEDARHRINVQFMQAKNVLKQEMIDLAIDLAIQRLPQEITDADSAKFIDQYLTSSEAEQDTLLDL